MTDSVAAVRVLVVEDFEPFRRVTCSMLAKIANLLIVGEVADGLEAVRNVQELQPDLILLDIGLPTMNGIEAARQIRTLSPQSKIIFVTQESSADIVQEAISLGASGYVLKAMVTRDLPAAVDAVLNGRVFVSPVLSVKGQTVGPG